MQRLHLGLVVLCSFRVFKANIISSIATGLSKVSRWAEERGGSQIEEVVQLESLYNVERRLRNSHRILMGLLE